MSPLVSRLIAAGLLLTVTPAVAQDAPDLGVGMAPPAPSISAAAPAAATPIAPAGPVPAPADAASPAPRAAETSGAADPAGAGEARLSPIVREVRALQRLQDRIALGDIAAHRAHRAMIDRVQEVLIAAPMDAWNDRRNVEAAIAYVLGGGPPAVLGRIRDFATIDGIDRRLLLGTMAYSMGDEAAAAAQLLNDVDARNLPPTLAGQIAMVQATLLLQTDPRLALGYLDLAGALSAGTLVEEAALRRALVVAGGIGDFARLEQVTSRYVRRFRNSVYAGNFREKFMGAVSRLNFASEDIRFGHLVELLDQFAPASRLDLYLFVARRALVGGNLSAVRLAAAKAAALSGRRPAAVARARFYGAAADITSEHAAAADAAYATLLDLDPALFSEEDEALLETVLDTARQIRTLDVRATTGPTDERTAPPSRPDGAAEPASVKEARILLERSDAVLRRSEK
jgi:chemotaxis protein MotC